MGANTIKNIIAGALVTVIITVGFYSLKSDNVKNNQRMQIEMEQKRKWLDSVRTPIRDNKISDSDLKSVKTELEAINKEMTGHADAQELLNLVNIRLSEILNKPEERLKKYKTHVISGEWAEANSVLNSLPPESPEYNEAKKFGKIMAKKYSNDLKVQNEELAAKNKIINEQNIGKTFDINVRFYFGSAKDEFERKSRNACLGRDYDILNATFTRMKHGPMQEMYGSIKCK